MTHKCSWCGETFETEEKKWKHLAVHKPKESREFCFVCNMMPCDCAYTDHSD